ncbi:hypothetical protein ACQPUZ_00415 [Clostridium tertium]
MIAELHGKISSRGTNLRETSEDNLTGNFFGALRYIPFSKGIQKILLEIIDKSNFNNYEAEEWAEKIEFWPYHKDGELDLIIDLNLVTIGIEVKYNSGLSSEDDVIKDYESEEPSKNQLSRESMIIKELAIEKNKKPILLFIARKNEGKEIVDNVKKRNIIENGVIFEFISWEEICSIIEELYKSSKLNYFEKVVIDDIYRLLAKKGFDSFKSFKSNISSSLIDKNEYFVFKENKKYNCMSKNDNDKFNFGCNVHIEAGEYYEFR